MAKRTRTIEDALLKQVEDARKYVSVTAIAREAGVTQPALQTWLAGTRGIGSKTMEGLYSLFNGKMTFGASPAFIQTAREAARKTKRQAK